MLSLGVVDPLALPCAEGPGDAALLYRPQVDLVGVVVSRVACSELQAGWDWADEFPRDRFGLQ